MIFEICAYHFINTIMILSEKTQTGLLAYWYAIVLLFVLLVGYGKQALGWILLKLYEWFVQSVPARI
jgi:hypothetical protein